MLIDNGKSFTDRFTQTGECKPSGRHPFDQENAGEDLEQTLKRYSWLYNHPISQKALNHQSPIAAMKEWQAKRAELLTKRVVNHAGPDKYAPSGVLV